MYVRKCRERIFGSREFDNPVKAALDVQNCLDNKITLPFAGL